MTREEIINGLIHIAAGNWDENSMAAITEAITILESQPTLPEGLEEAARIGLDTLLEDGAEMFNTEDAARMWDYEGKTEGEIVKAAYIKGGYAGAKWQAEQGVSVNGMFGIRGVESDNIVNALLDGGLKMGDKVIVQIRKK